MISSLIYEQRIRSRHIFLLMLYSFAGPYLLPLVIFIHLKNTIENMVFLRTLWVSVKIEHDFSDCLFGEEFHNVGQLFKKSQLSKSTKDQRSLLSRGSHPLD